MSTGDEARWRVKLWRVQALLVDRNLEVEILSDAVWGAPDATDDLLLAPLRALSPQARIVAVADLFREEAFAAANLP